MIYMLYWKKKIILLTYSISHYSVYLYLYLIWYTTIYRSLLKSEAKLFQVRKLLYDQRIP